MFWRRDELVCQEMVELITDYIEGGLTRSQRKRFQAHIAGCEHCAEYLEQMRATIRVTGMLRVDDLTPAMREEFAVFYRSWREA